MTADDECRQSKARQEEIYWRKSAQRLPPTRPTDFVGFCAFLGAFCALTCTGAGFAFAAFAARAFSFAARIACSRCALRTSGFMFLFARISVREEPAIARWNLVVRRVFFFASVSPSRPFLCFLRYKTVHVVLRGFLFTLCAASHLALKNVKTCRRTGTLSVTPGARSRVAISGNLPCHPS